jgi:RNA polymerase sigma-70 factor (ECF subfamily)
MMDPTDPTTLVEEARRGQPGAAEALVDRWLPEVLAWCARLGGPGVDPEDAAHDVFVVVLTRLDTLRKPASFPSWIFGITRRVLVKHRRRSWFKRWMGDAEEVASASPDPLDRHADAETMRRVRAALETLPAAQREVLVLCDLEERTAVEAARLLGVPVGTVKSRLRLGRERFKEAALRRHLAPVAEGSQG